MNVLSLFDGMSCAMIALQRLGINPDNYYASEIDKYAIQVSKANWPQIIHIGDVTKVHYFDGMLITEFGSYEVSFAKGLICGGSPCQGFSFAGKQLNFEDPRSKLFFEFVRIWKEIKAEHPDVKVFLENVVMKKEYQSVISEALGLQAVLINSALVCAQNSGTTFVSVEQDDKSLTLTAGYRFNPSDKEYLIDRKKQKVALSEKEIDYMNREVSDGRTHWDFGHHSDSDSDKSPALVANLARGVPYNVLIDRTTPIQVGMAGDIRPHALDSRKSGIQEFGTISSLENKATTHIAAHTPKFHNGVTYRKLTTTECERLQGVPDHYTKVVSNTQAYKMLGNGWQVDTILHLFEPLLWLDIL